MGGLLGAKLVVQDALLVLADMSGGGYVVAFIAESMCVKHPNAKLLEAIPSWWLYV